MIIITVENWILLEVNIKSVWWFLDPKTIANINRDENGLIIEALK